MSHTPPVFIRYGKNSSAFFSLKYPTSLVIFVHGFNGNATGTWEDFPRIIRENKDFENADIVFYGYNSLQGQANNNAIRLYKFLKSICELNPNKLGFYRESIGNDFVYERVLVVAHSLGAVIVRRALLNAKSEGKNWLKKCRMVLFAPAHKGARIPDLIAESFPVMGKIFIALGFISIPILDDLRPNSQTILNLIEDSKNYLLKQDGGFTVAHSVVWADKDIVVHNDVFCSDPVAILVDNKTHTSVCKPKSVLYLDPYIVVKKALID